MNPELGERLDQLRQLTTTQLQVKYRTPAGLHLIKLDDVFSGFNRLWFA